MSLPQWRSDVASASEVAIAGDGVMYVTSSPHHRLLAGNMPNDRQAGGNVHPSLVSDLARRHAVGQPAGEHRRRTVVGALYPVPAGAGREVPGADPVALTLLLAVVLQ